MKFKIEKVSVQGRIRREQIIIYLGIAILLGFSIWNNLDDLTLRNAVGGFSPIDYINRISYPESFVNNFENGVNNFNSSLIFHFYEAASKAGIEPEDFQRAVIFLSVSGFAAVLWFFSATILPNTSSYIHLLTVTFGLATDVLNHDLARWGSFAGLSSGQMYSPAVIFSVFALANSFRKKWIGCFFSVGIAFCFHATIGMIVGLICVAILLAVPKQLKMISTWSAGIIGLLVTGSWYLFIIHPSLGGYELMDTEIWVNWARFGNFHWFPFSLNVFGSEHGRKITPILAMLILSLTRLIDAPVSEQTKHMWYAAVVCTVIMTCIGLLTSLYSTHPTLIKLALHRSSMFLLLLFLPLALHLLLTDITSDRVYNRFLALIILTTPIIGSAAGFPLLYSLLRFGTELWKTKEKHALPIYLNAIVLIFALAISTYVVFTSGAKFTDPAFISQKEAILFAFIVTLALAGLKWLKLWTNYSLALPVLALACILFVSYQLSQTSFTQKDKAQAYLDLQLWAKENTSPGSLFMTDPTRAYGWRDYSQRASFGVAREWIHTSWLYTANKGSFDEGMRRASLFGVDPNEYLQHSLENGKRSVGKNYRFFLRHLGDAFYSLSVIKLIELAKSENIDYFVFEKRNTYHALLPGIVYENDYYVVVKPDLSAGIEFRTISEEVFPSEPPLLPTPAEKLTQDSGLDSDWVNVGWRGQIMVSSVDKEPGVLRLTSGFPVFERRESSDHVLLLKPRKTGQKGLPVYHRSQMIEFECELRFMGRTSVGDVKLRIDAYTPSGWKYAAGMQFVEPSQEWKKMKASFLLNDEVIGITPIIEWRPKDAGEILDFKMPRVRWIKSQKRDRSLD
nr:hypothetical protein [uncultured Desulfobacter sp.]